MYFYAILFSLKYVIMGCDVKHQLQSPQRSILTLNVISRINILDC